MKANNLKNKAVNLINQLDKTGEKSWVKWLVFCIYTLLLVAFAVQHEPWYDEYHAWGMVYRMNFAELWQAMRIEGHFCLWHLLLWPFVKWLNMDWYAMLFVSIPLMLIATYLVLHRLQFPFIGKLLILFSSPFLYYYPIVSRCYALIPPLLAAIAVLYQQRKYPFLYCLLLGLLANTHAYIEGLVAILWLLFVYDNIWSLRKTDRKAARQNMLAAFITIVFVLLAFVQVVGGLIDVSHGLRPLGGGKDTPDRWLSVFYGGYHIKFFDVLHKHIRFIPKLNFLFTLCCYILAIICAFEVLRDKTAKRWQAILVLFVSIAWQVLFATNIYGMNWQRIGLLYFCLVLVLWMYYYRTTKKSYLYALLLICFLLTTPILFYYTKLKTPQNCETTFVRTAEKIVPTDKIIYTHDYMWSHIDLVRRDWKYITPEIEEDCIASDSIDIYILTCDDTIKIANCHYDCLLSTDPLKLYHITKP